MLRDKNSLGGDNDGQIEVDINVINYFLILNQLNDCDSPLIFNNFSETDNSVSFEGVEIFSIPLFAQLRLSEQMLKE